MSDSANLTEVVLTAEVVEAVVPDSGPAITPGKKPPARQMPKWEAETRDRVRTAIRRFAKPLPI
jgi:hypothetical protein